MILLLLLLASCTPSSPQEVRGVAMTMEYRIIADLPTPKIEQIAAKTFSEVDAIYNNWNPNSEVSQISRLPAHTPHTLSPDLAIFLSQIDPWIERTGGLFDPTIAPLQQLWRTHLEQGERPSKGDIERLAPSIGWDKLHIEKGVLWKEDEATALDLGGVAKGYAVDLLVERLRAVGARHIWVEWSGEIATFGGHPERREWRIAIQKPTRGPSAAAAIIEMKEGAIATSGNYHQQWKTSEGDFTHICDPRTMEALPLSGVASATVKSEKCWEADLMATALMIAPNERNFVDSETQIWLLNDIFAQPVDE